MTDKTDKHPTETSPEPAKATPATGEPFVPRMLTKSEIESLRQHNHRCHEENMKALKTMDLSRLMV